MNADFKPKSIGPFTPTAVERIDGAEDVLGRWVPAVAVGGEVFWHSARRMDDRGEAVETATAHLRYCLSAFLDPDRDNA